MSCPSTPHHSRSSGMWSRRQGSWSRAWPC
uniref:Uncharacterized protein n=1 Tax=Anguilla anguilla TaxID=7936 RepID=A0A0E9XJK5_ANGAN